jgi:hypothetical protein
MRPRWRVQVCDSASSSDVGCLSGQGFFDEISVGAWLHVEWMNARLWWLRIVHTHVQVQLRSGRACDVVGLETYAAASSSPTLDGPWRLRARDGRAWIERGGEGRVEEIWVKDWLHVERVTGDHARVRIGTTHFFDVRVQRDAWGVALRSEDRAP